MLAEQSPATIVMEPSPGAPPCVAHLGAQPPDVLLTC
jgi:hypothetical protein